jgi:hypothetical protein
MNEPMLNRAFEDRSFPKASDGNARSLSARDNDPLAELARLVGQDDPFRDIFGDAKRAGGQREPAATDDTSWLEAALRPGYPAHQDSHLQHEPEPAFGYEEPQSDAYAEDEHELGPDISLQKKRGGLALAAILSVAVIGGIGLLAFRDDLSGNAADGTPPVIRAEPGPNKTIPEKDDTADARQHAKLIYDRVGAVDPAGAAKVIPRAEEPVELPPAETRGTIAPDAPPPAGQASSTAQPGQAEPRRVRTVLIKPDGSATDAADATASPGTTASASVQNFDRPTGYPFSIIDEEPGSSAQTPAPAFAAPPSSAGNVPLPPARPPSTTMVRSASIAPTAAPAPARPAPQAAAPAPPRPAPQAAAPAPARPAPQAAAPTRVASAPANAVPVSSGSGGRFAVQLTSQKSEQEARDAYSGLQRRFGSVLGSYPPSIQKADLGSRGIFYRVRVGTNSREDAVRLCTTLKAQGGDCVVQAN